MKILLYSGAFGSNNFGDDALLVSHVRVLNKIFPSAELLIADLKSNYYQKLLDPRDKVRVIQPGEKPDVFIFAGGTQFHGLPRKKAFTTLNLCNLIGSVRKELGRELYFYRRRKVMTSSTFAAAIGVGVGPFADDTKLEKDRAILSALDFVAVRDQNSINVCDNWGLGQVILGSDLCFYPGTWARPKLSSINQATSAVKKIGFIVRDWPFENQGSDYKESLLKTVDTLRTAGIADVSFISFRSHNRAGRDFEWLETLQSRNEKDILTWDPWEMSLNSFSSELSKFDCIITARYHGAVFAALFGIPFICVGIEPKLLMVAEALKNTNHLWASPYDPDQLSNAIKYNLLNDENVKHELLKYCEAEGAKAIEMMQALSHELSNAV